MVQANILWCVSGSIALYKSLDSISELTRDGYSVHVVLTQHACKFIHPMTFEAISQNKVYSDLFSDPMVHIRLADEAALCVVAPASYDVIGKIANGIADDLVTALVAVAGCPKMIVPAMNVSMYENAICQENVRRLRSYGYDVVDPEYGQMACGHVGVGRFPEKDTILAAVKKYSFSDQGEKRFYDYTLHKKQVLITCGGTREAIDPVRYIGNYSSGKMGMALARAALSKSAKLRLICAHIDVDVPPGVEVVHALTAHAMLEELKKHIHWADIFIMVAAVSDYRPTEYSTHKIKKAQQSFMLEMTKTQDILETLAVDKKPHQLFIGFSAESDNLLDNARKKLVHKQLDMIIANNINKEGIGFSSDDNEVCILFSDSSYKWIDKMSKNELSLRIFEEIANHFYKFA